MILRRAAVLLIGALSVSGATIDEVFPLLHPIDPAAPFAFHQWPQKRRDRDNFGVTFMIWPDRATLFLDERIPLTTHACSRRSPLSSQCRCYDLACGLRG